MTPLRQYIPGNDYEHKMQEPWDTIAHVRADLRQAKGLLRRALTDLCDAHTAPGERELRLALGKVDDALERIGGGE